MIRFLPPPYTVLRFSDVANGFGAPHSGHVGEFRLPRKSYLHFLHWRPGRNHERIMRIIIQVGHAPIIMSGIQIGNLIFVPLHTAPEV